MYTGTVWAEGVSREDGWKDVDKSLDGVDNNMCYAASATNLITWWQDGYGSRLTSSAPRDINAIWNTYKDNNIYPASAGDPLAAINWWISGVYAPADAEEEQRSLFNPVENASLITLKPFPGFYYDEYGLNKGDLGAFLGFSTEYTVSYYDELFSIDVAAGANNKVYFNEEGEIGYYEFMAMQGISGIYIYGVSSICPSACASWQLVPEPSTSTLALLALTALATRHRRR